ncbi:MAG TPA: DUF4856 domain-containing protein, partial [Chitinophagaceae bacterium]|nr:DUF4856 domain-containing protein [Chitinophagaceae bacterium]
MKNRLFNVSAVLLALTILASCSDDPISMVKPYSVPSTYAFSNVNYTNATRRVKMTVEIDAYLKTANAGSAVVPLDGAKVNNMFANTNAPFADPSLNTSGINTKDLTADYALFKSYADSVLLYNTGANATPGTGGFIARGANKIIVGPHGLEYEQAFLKGVMGSLYFKEAVTLLTAVKSISATDTAAAQAKWDEAFGYLAVPANYDSAKTYSNADADRPLLWGGYLAERGKPIQAGGILFSAFIKGRAA